MTLFRLPVVVLGFAAAVSFAADDKDTRGGTCEDAKQQYDYFCNRTGNPNDIMVQTEIACNNAKRNMAAACEGKVQPDASYKFDEHGKVLAPQQ